MSDYREARAVCPYYKKPKGAGIRCEGYLPGMVVSLTFVDPAQRRIYLEDFCFSGCWRGCEIAALAAKKYEEQ